MCSLDQNHYIKNEWPIERVFANIKPEDLRRYTNLKPEDLHR